MQDIPEGNTPKELLIFSIFTVVVIVGAASAVHFLSEPAIQTTSEIIDSAIDGQESEWGPAYQTSVGTAVSDCDNSQCTVSLLFDTPESDQLKTVQLRTGEQVVEEFDAPEDGSLKRIQLDSKTTYTVVVIQSGDWPVENEREVATIIL